MKVRNQTMLVVEEAMNFGSPWAFQTFSVGDPSQETHTSLRKHPRRRHNNLFQYRRSCIQESVNIGEMLPDQCIAREANNKLLQMTLAYEHELVA